MKFLRFSGKQKRLNIVVRRVVGNSMLPTLRPDQLVLGIGNKRNLKKGDVVIAIYEGREIIKRIADTKGKLIFLVGDNKIASTDSRYIGWFDTKNISNKIIWPKT